MEKKFYPLAVNILNLQKYNLNYFSSQEVILFDYFIVKGKAFGFKEFYHPTRIICEETGIKKHSVEQILKKFEKIKILNIRKSGMPKIKHFIVDYQSIGEQLPVFYNLKRGGIDFEHSLVEFYRSLIETSQQKNITKENLNKREKDIEIERSSILKSFQDFLIALQSNSSLKATNFKFDELIFFKALEQYGFQELKESMEKYFKINLISGTLTSFFGPYLKTGKIEFIENVKQKQNKEVRDFINELEIIYNKRRSLLSNESKSYPSTKLSVTSINVSQVANLLKQMSKDQIKKSFIAYVDKVTKGELKVKKLLSYFLTKKDKDYEVILFYLEHYNHYYLVTHKG